MSTGAWLTVVSVLVVVIFILFLRIQRDKKNSFSPEQNRLVKELLEKELSRVEQERQDAIDKAAKEGKRISTDGALKYAEELKLRYETEGRHDDARIVNQLINDIRQKYGAEIPIDEAFRLMKEFEKGGAKG